MPAEHYLRRPVPARHVLERRRRALALGILLALGVAGALALILIGCGGASNNTLFAPPPVAAVQPLQITDVQNIVQTAVNSANVDMVVAVVDRAGFVLGVFRTQNAPANASGNFGLSLSANDVAVGLARTGAFFSNDQAPLSSRTVRFISGIHFPPGVMNTANAALYGIENTNRGCNLAASIDAIVPPATTIASASPGYGVITGKADVNDSDATAVNPGGVPIFKNGQEVGGVGVVAADPNTAEYVAFAAAGMIAMSGPNAMTDGVGFPAFPAPGIVSINGITLPFVNQTTPPSGVTSGIFDAAYFTVGPIASP